MKTQEIISEGILKLTHKMEVDRFSKEILMNKAGVHFVGVTIGGEYKDRIKHVSLHNNLKEIYKESELDFIIYNLGYGKFTLTFSQK